MTDGPPTQAQLRGALDAAQRALGEARDEREIAERYLRECDAAIALKSRSNDVELDPPTVRAALVFRGRLEVERALEEAQLVDTRRADALTALLDVLTLAQIEALSERTTATRELPARALLDALDRRGEHGARLGRAAPGSIRPLLISWAELCERTTDAQRALARDRVDRALQGVDLEAAATAPEQLEARHRAIALLCDRVLLEPVETRRPWLARLVARIDENPRAVEGFRDFGLLPSLAAIAAVECGELALGVALFARVLPWIASILANEYAGAAHFAAALAVMQRSLTPEQLERLERSALESVEARLSSTPSVALRIARMLRSSQRAVAMERAIERSSRGSSWPLTDDDVPLERSDAAPGTVANVAEQVRAVCGQLVRGGRTHSALSGCLRVVAARGPWVDAMIPAIEAAFIDGPLASWFEARFTFEWLFEAARGGHARAEGALLAIASAHRQPWHCARRWYRGQRDAFVDEMLLARSRTRDTPMRASWLRSLIDLRAADRASLASLLAPALGSLLDDGFLLQQLAPYVRKEDEHRVACAALDLHSREPALRQAGALVALAVRIDSVPLAAKCLRRYLHNTSASAFDRKGVASAMARLGADPRVRRALGEAYRKREVPLEHLPLDERVEAIERAVAADSLWPSLAAALEGAHASLIGPPVARALGRLIRADGTRVTTLPFNTLLPWVADEDLLALVEVFPRICSDWQGWSALIARVAERAPAQLEPTLLAYERDCSATRSTAYERWARAIIDRAQGDTGAIERAFAKNSFAGLSDGLVAVLARRGWLDPVIDAIASSARPTEFANVLWYCAKHLSAEQRARLTRKADELVSTQNTRFDIERVAPYASRAAIARAWSKRVRSPSIELPLRNVTLALAGPEGLERVCAQIAGALAR